MEEKQDLSLWKEARDLYARLYGAVEDGRFDPSFVDGLERFLAISEDRAAGFYFLGSLSLALGDAEEAYGFARKAYRLRKVSPPIWRLLVLSAEALGRDDEVLLMKGLLEQSAPAFAAGKPLVLDATKQAYLWDWLTPPHYVPFHGVPHGDGLKTASLLGKYIFTVPEEETYRPFVGVYNRDTYYETMTTRMHMMDQALDENDIARYTNIPFDIIKAGRPATSYTHPGGDVVLPVTGADEFQGKMWKLEIESAERKGSLLCGESEWRFLRLKEETKLSSDRPFVVGKPIVMHHGKERKKLVLNLFLDALAWPAMRQIGYRDVPNLMKFFQKGVIFENTFSPAEYTLPSYAAIETGRYLHHTQMFNENIPAPMERDYTTLSEQMEKLGYYTTLPSDDGDELYIGTLRGFQRMITNRILMQPMGRALERAIDELDAFGETDIYMLLHVTDPHPFPTIAWTPLLSTQSHLGWEKIARDQNYTEVSVNVSHSDLFEMDTLRRIQRMDTMLGILFSYIEEHYDEDDYIVTAYSDHGSGVFTDDPWMFDDMRCGASLMVRGAGVPRAGHVDELASSIDLYPILGKLAGFDMPPDIDGNLPAVFGGKERQMVASNSIFPGQTYKLGLRTKEYEARIESKDFVRMDGTVDMEGASVRVFRRDASHQEIHDEEILRHFVGETLRFTASFNEPEVGQCQSQRL